MKKIIFLTVLAVTICFLAGSAQAQLINYERRNKNLQKKASTPKAAAETAQQQVKKIMDPEVVSRVDQIYDINGDGRLQADELNDYYGDVIESVNRRGSFRVSQGVLKKFDTNDDDRISRYEVYAIESEMK